MTAPAALRTDRLQLRSWQSADAPALQPLLASNAPHLGGWIPAHVAAAAPLAELARRLGGFAADFAAAHAWRYALLTRDNGALLGEVDLFPRDAAGRAPQAAADRCEIGYWLRADCTGQGLATEAARAMLGVAGALPGMRQVEIRCDARNLASAAIPRRLGFALATSSPASAPDEGAAQLWVRPLPDVRIDVEPLGGAVAAALIAALNAELSARYPESGATHFALDPAEVAPGAGAFVVARAHGRPVACGALRRLRDALPADARVATTGELKRMYVAAHARGQGIGRAFLARLEAEARLLGMRRLVLETSTRQGEALGLYRDTGFRDIPPYGEYAASAGTSVCLAKEL